MPIEALTLANWLSPGYPLGSFAYSHGLETAIATGTLSSANEVKDWLRDLLHHGSARNDAIWLRLAFEAGSVEELHDLDARARSYAASAERVLESARQGAAFAATSNPTDGLDLPDLLLPLAVGAAVRRAGFDPGATTALYLQSFVANLVSCAVRLVPLGQTEGQRIVAALRTDCIEVARVTEGATADDIHGAAFLSDIMAMRHETLQPRLFRS